jgi:hypothetical protein
MAGGSTTLTATAYDAAGNNATSAPVVVTVANATVADTTPPSVAITNPGNGTKVGKTVVTVTASASDAGGLASMTLSIDGVTVASGNTGKLSYVEPRNLATGTHTIAVWAQDKAAMSVVRPQKRHPVGR